MCPALLSIVCAGDREVSVNEGPTEDFGPDRLIQPRYVMIVDQLFQSGLKLCSKWFHSCAHT